MGLFGWIKKDANQHRRRESAPPSTSNITSTSSSASAARDEAYLEALTKFNQWRSRQRLERISEGCPLRTGVIEEHKESEGGAQSDFSSDVPLTSDGRRALNKKFELPKSPRYSRHRQDTGPPKKPKRSVEFYRNINRIPENGEPNLNNGKNNNMADRYSLPAVMPTSRKNKSRLSKPNNNTIYENEVEEFEQMHVQDNLGDTYAVQSPPSRFFKENSNPYFSTSTLRIASPTIVDSTPKKQVNLNPKRSRNFKDKPAPQPPMTTPDPPSSHKKHNITNESGTESPFAGSYRKYELNSSSIYDEHVISSRAYRGEMKPLNSSVQSPAVKERRKSPSYQTIVNKHGDLVDYALPFSDTTDIHSELNSTKNGDILNDIRACEEVINENFRFLNSDIHPSSILMDDSTSMINEPISVLKERGPQIVTDLDRSMIKEEPELVDQLDEVDLVIHEPQDILLELDSLEKWSKSIQISDDFLQKQFSERSMLEFFQQASSQLLICWPKEVHYRVGGLRSSFMAPLEFSCGLFRNAPVSLRKYSLNVDRSLYFAEEACKKDFEILGHIKHFAVASLMAVCFDGGLNQATLVLEPFDFTLFDYIHKMNKRLSLLHAITVVQQISLAVSYLQECGYIHSNISSGCVLMRKYPYAVKLTSFELTTEASDTVRKEIENRYGSTSSSRNSMTSSQNEELKKITTYSRLIKNDEQFLRDKYRKLSKEVSDSRKGQFGTLGDNSGYDCRASRYLPYCKEYREKFSLFYYVAPELLVPKSNFVFPSKSTDVYSLTLLLWEILNGYVPFVVYSRQELEKLQVSANLQLPMFEKERCDRFRQVFESGLSNLSARQINVTDILDTLDCLLLEQGLDKTTHMNGFSEDFEEQVNSSEIRKKNEINDIRKQNVSEKTDKIYFQSNGGYVNVENSKKISRETTFIDIDDHAPQRSKQQPKKPARKINKSKAQKEPDMKSTKKSPLSSSLSHSAIYQTIFDFNNKFLSPRSSKQAIYERTSTVKKQKSSLRSNKVAAKELFEPINSFDKTDSFQKLTSGDSNGNTTLTGTVPEVIGPLEVCTKESPSKLNININKHEISKELELTQTPERDRTNEIQPVETSKSCDSSPGTKRKNYSRLSNSLRFTIGDITLPDTPIARKNKIRKHAWLSDQKLVLTDDNTSTPVTPQGRRACAFFNDLGSRVSRGGRSTGGLSTPLNLNISSSMQEIKPKTINISVNIIKGPDMGTKLKSHSQEFNKTTPSIVDIDFDDKTKNPETTVKAESTDNVFEGSLWKKEKELCERTQLNHSVGDLDREGSDGDASDKVITAHLTSVRDAVRKIETTFENTGFDYSPNRKPESHKKCSDDRKISDDSVVVEESLLVPTKVLELEKTFEQLPPIEEPNNSITRLDVVLTNNTLKKKEELLQQQHQPQPSAQPKLILPEASVFNPNSQLFMRRKATSSGSVIQRTVYRESIVSSTDLPGLDSINSSQASISTTPIPPGSARKKKLTTRVTVNMRKISRRASDMGTSPASSRPSSQNLDEDLPSSGCLTPTNGATGPIRHSCGNDLLKAFATLRLVPSSEDVGGSRCSSANDERRSLCTPVKAPVGGPGPSRNGAERFVCCNCGNSMVPADNLNVPAGSRIGMTAAFSELNFPRESLASMFEDNLGLISQQQPRGTLSTIPNAKSTEDLYIDDDFYQGLNLGANMELVEFVDDGHYLDEFGYDIYTTEEIYDDDEDDENSPEMEALCGMPGDCVTPILVVTEAEEVDSQQPAEEQFLSKCADMNASSADGFGSVFSPMPPTAVPEQDLKDANGQEWDQ
ncbi:uncharacterized protein LOC5570969 [Aedes aegypti]|uniref:Protein kinase domain-containing protein n=1 Tax=Aedes aegypti TaxID=7159 RepID=A0A6I8TMD7_AEDAE|nr:uncharacterized protein LOC5570969 [Aedes aegypti]XP_021705598.1 uncharacterized protein LOC5570969 [Aedes aegypti]XP_021705599.1 uncharacterized protein LOC5570969 [Aedes aegypti]